MSFMSFFALAKGHTNMGRYLDIARRTAESLRGAVNLPAHWGDWPEEWLEAFIERAAIMEFDGGLPRPEAERLAEESVREAHRRSQERQV